MDLLVAIFVVLTVIVGVKLLVWFLKAGVFLVLLPVKLFVGLLLAVVFLLVVPLAVVPAFLSLLFVFAPVLLIGLGVYLIVKYA